MIAHLKAALRAAIHASYSTVTNACSDAPRLNRGRRQERTQEQQLSVYLRWMKGFSSGRLRRSDKFAARVAGQANKATNKARPRTVAP